MIGNKKDACQLHIWYICMYFILATHRTTNTINFWQVITVYWDRCFIITYMQHLQLAVTALWCDWCLVKGYWNQSFCVYMKSDVCFVRLFDVLCTSVCCYYDGDDDYYYYWYYCYYMTHSLTHCCAWPAEGRSVLHIERSWPAIQAASTDRPTSSSTCCSQFLRGRPGGRFQSAAGGVPVWALARCGGWRTAQKISTATLSIKDRF